MSLCRRVFTPVFIRSIFKQEVNKTCLHTIACKNINITSKTLYFYPNQLSNNTVRWKSKKDKYDSDDEDIVVDDDTSLSKDSKVVKFSTTSMRTDVILKSALAISRNKIEQMFYESKIRINGRKILKKSASVSISEFVNQRVESTRWARRNHHIGRCSYLQTNSLQLTTKCQISFDICRLDRCGIKVMKSWTREYVKLGDEVDVIKMVSPKNPDHLYVSRVEILNITPKEESISITARRFKNLLIENYEDDPHKLAVAENE